jgi:hypothetical protein
MVFGHMRSHASCPHPCFYSEKQWRRQWREFMLKAHLGSDLGVRWQQGWSYLMMMQVYQCLTVWVRFCWQWQGRIISSQGVIAVSTMQFYILVICGRIIYQLLIALSMLCHLILPKRSKVNFPFFSSWKF